MGAKRLPIVGVMGSGTQAHAERAEPLGRWLAGAGVHLLTGGGGGVMLAVSRAFCEVRARAGSSIGVLPGDVQAGGHAAPSGYPNPWIEVPIQTHLALRGEKGAELGSRNHINVLSSDVIIALPGGAGTASEARLARRYGRPIVAFIREPQELPGLPEGIARFAELEGIVEFVRSRVRDALAG